MKIWFVVGILALLPLAAALDPHTTTAYGYAYLYIQNDPPVLEELQLTPQPAYKDSTLECLGKVKDEQLDTVKLHYTWLINGQKSLQTRYQLTGFNENDRVQCTAYAEDSSHKTSLSKTITTHVQPVPITAKALNTVLNGLGMDTHIAHTLRLQEQGLPAVTGFVIRESGKNGTSELLVVLFGLVFLTVLNANLLLRHYVRRHSSEVR